MNATDCLHGYDWEPIAAAMIQFAEVNEDDFLTEVAYRAYRTSVTHSPDGDGCGFCQGVMIELCSHWSQEQRTMLAWLRQRAGLI